MKNVTKILIAAALCTAIFANQRIDALGGDSGFWPGDRDNISSFPAAINDHSFLEMDNVGSDANNTTATILWGDDTKWGFSYDVADANSWFNLMWGNGDMGLTFSYTSATTDSNDDGTDGMAIGYGQNFSWGELGAGFTSAGDATTTWANWRGDLGCWVFSNAKAGLSMWDDGGDNSSMGLGFDMWTNMDAGGANVLFAMGFGYSSNDDAAGNQTTMTLPAVTIAVEGDLTDWATVRGFVNADYTISASNDGYAGDDAVADGYTGSTYAYGFGLGFNWGQLSADIGISEDLFQDPFGAMTGYDDLTTSEVTLSWSF